MPYHSPARSVVRVIGAAFVSLTLSVGHADILHYGGDPAGGYAALDTNGVSVYDNFTIPIAQTWTINGFFGQIGGLDPNGPVPLVSWDVRIGMTSCSSNLPFGCGPERGLEVAKGISTDDTTVATPLPYVINWARHLPSQSHFRHHWYSKAARPIGFTWVHYLRMAPTCLSAALRHMEMPRVRHSITFRSSTSLLPVETRLPRSKSGLPIHRWV